METVNEARKSTATYTSKQACLLYKAARDYGVNGAGQEVDIDTIASFQKLWHIKVRLEW